MPCHQVDVPKWSGRPFFWVLGFSANVVRHVCRELVSSDCPHTVGQQLHKGGPDGQIPELELYLQGKFLPVSIYIFLLLCCTLLLFTDSELWFSTCFVLFSIIFLMLISPPRVDFALPLNYVLRVQQKYIVPTVNTHWESMQASLLQEVTEPLVLAGDGRNDSPGHCAKYCTYSLMDVATNKILALSCIDCRQTNLNSVVMEKAGFLKATAQVTTHVKVAEIVTDAHPQIAALMSKCLLIYSWRKICYFTLTLIEMGVHSIFSFHWQDNHC